MRFIDPNDLVVELEFKENEDNQHAKHVLGIPVYNNQFVLTHHKVRGIEFPGGKVESHEQNQEAVIRELYEETGAIAKRVRFIASYIVYDQIPFDKDVYFIDVERIEEKSDYHETYGPIIVDHIEEVENEKKSFLLKDDAILKCVERVKELGLFKK